LIKDALSGKLNENTLTPKEQHETYTFKGENRIFTPEELEEKWNQYLMKLNDQPNLQSTLSKVPEVGENFCLILEVDNTVQETMINNIRPELVAWLRKELKNSNIELKIRISENIKGKIIYSDTEKYTEMVSKNPMLEVLKNKFNLDFS
jgi:hypothetical protein